VLQKITQAFDEVLTPRQRAAIDALVLEGVPMDLVAEQLGTNRNALYKLLHDARRKLRDHLEDEGLPPEYIIDLFER
jgi:RNA polymerase sigma-70 factor (ECF subfamily)